MVIGAPSLVLLVLVLAAVGGAAVMPAAADVPVSPRETAPPIVPAVGTGAGLYGGYRLAARLLE
jgi:hypothetical protein